MDTLRLVALRGGGLEAHVSPLGATLVRLLAPDRRGAPVDCVLGYDSADEYLAAGTYFGGVVGRCANRVAAGAFTLDGVRHQLATNNGANALHGGPRGFHTRWWSVEALLDATGADVAPPPPGASPPPLPPAGVRLRYTSPDGEEGYPGSLTAVVSYLLCSRSPAPGTPPRPSLVTQLRATCDVPTIVNLAQHAYWNLGGHASGSVLLSHALRLWASRYTPVDEGLIPTGDTPTVVGTPFDFTGSPRVLGERVDAVPGGKGYDHNLCVDGPNSARGAGDPSRGLSPVADLICDTTGIALSLWADQPGCQLYVGGFLDGEPGKGGAVYPKFGGLCLETQTWPDGLNHAKNGFPSPVLRPGQEYEHNMVVQFTTLP